MTEPEPEKTPRGRGARLIVLAGLAGAAIGVAAIYGIGWPDGNGTAAAECRAALQTAQQVKPLATGEVAAFLPTTQPKVMSDLSFYDAAGAPVTLADFAGKTVLLNLWATWCAPCRAEMPALDRLQGELGGDDFQVVAVNVDTRGGDRPKAFLDEIGVTRLGLYKDDSMGIFNDMRARGRATGLPTTMLIGPQGCEIGTMYGPAEWDSPDALALIRAAKGD